MENFHVDREDCRRYPLVVSLPHSGTVIPEEVRRSMLPGAVLPNMDWFLPELYSFLPKLGVTTLINRISRYVIDPNRPPDASAEDYRQSLVYQKTTWGRPIYAAPLPREEIDRRTRQYYHPYHDRLAELLDEKRRIFGRVLLLDLHSFANPAEEIPEDIILGDCRGESCLPQLSGLIQDGLERAGFSVSRNIPYGGGYLTRHYGTAFGPTIQAVQIELRYSAYIADRYFGEEELTGWDECVLRSAQRRLREFFTELLPKL